MNPDKGNGGSLEAKLAGCFQCHDRSLTYRIDARTIKIACGTGNDASNKQSHNHGCRFHDWRTKSLAQQDRDEYGESKAWKESVQEFASSGNITYRCTARSPKAAREVLQVAGKQQKSP